jgi:DNA modification methylase
MKQASLFTLEEQRTAEIQEWGTFKDSLRAPIHNWFTYPAGFSYKAVEASIKANAIIAGQTIYDPFMGTGTTNLTAKKLGLNSYGVEAHPFVFRIARTKLNWEIDKTLALDAVAQIETAVRNQRRHLNGHLKKRLAGKFPELVEKCYEDKTLYDLLLIREAIFNGEFPLEVVDLLFVGLTSLLRQVSLAETGWPYIAPKKQKTTSLNKDALFEFSRQISRMIQDVEITKSEANSDYLNTTHHVYNGDSRDTKQCVPNRSADHVFTSPPYLNNFDYADRTRLELYFFGEAKTWGEITQNIRTKLITSATTQITRDDPRYALSDELRKASPDVYDFLCESVSKLGALRLTKGGKKSYDHLVSGYFNDMFLVISDVYRVLKPKTKAVFVLGDSAPYGVHIPTDEVIGKIGLGVGFADYGIEVLRARGGKWKDNPQRHDVALRESIVTLQKA